MGNTRVNELEEDITLPIILRIHVYEENGKPRLVIRKQLTELEKIKQLISLSFKYDSLPATVALTDKFKAELRIREIELKTRCKLMPEEKILNVANNAKNL